MVADVIDEVKHLGARKYLFWERGQQDYVADYKESDTRMFLRLACENGNSGKATVEKVFGEVEWICPAETPGREIAFAAPAMTEEKLEQKLRLLEGLTVISRIRLADM